MGDFSFMVLVAQALWLGVKAAHKTLTLAVKVQVL